MSTPSIVNHLWQSSCFVLVAGLLAFVLRKHSAKIRYWVWLSASLKFLLPFALLVSLGSVVPRPARQPVPVAGPVFPNTIVQIAQPFPTASSTTLAVRTSLDWVAVVIGVVWVAGFLAITLARWRSWLSVRAALRASTPIELPIPIRSVITPGMEEPGIVGFLRPVLVLPAQLLEHLNPRQLGAILTHEMCHVRRRDNLFAAVHMAVEAIFWFHPLVWWIGSRLVEERELACDEEVLGTGCEPADYVQGILKVCRLYTESPLRCVSGVTGADTKKRMRAILAGGIARELSRGNKVALAAIGLAALVMPIVIGVMNAPAIRAQDAPATTQKFEVASIKPNGKRGGGTVRSFPGRFTASAPLRVLIEAAYHVQPFQIVGGPEWMRSDQYEIDAKATGNAVPAQLMLMLRPLLEDRFQLRIRRESREMPVYGLAPARGGLNLPPPREGSCGEEQPPRPGESRKPARILEQHPGYTVYESALRCGAVEVSPEGGSWRMRGGKVSMGELVRVLSGMLGRTVIDQTGFTGVFDINLEYQRDETTDSARRAGAVSPAGELPVDSSSPSIFSAVQQVGLRLESTKGPVDVLVIEHAERPSEN